MTGHQKIATWQFSKTQHKNKTQKQFVKTCHVSMTNNITPRNNMKCVCSYLFTLLRYCHTSRNIKQALMFVLSPEAKLFQNYLKLKQLKSMYSICTQYRQALNYRNSYLYWKKWYWNVLIFNKLVTRQLFLLLDGS